MVIPTHIHVLLALIEAKGLQFLLEGNERKEYITFAQKSQEYRDEALRLGKEWYG